METERQAPTFVLTDLSGVAWRLADMAGEIVVLNFWSAECPWSRHYDGWLAARANVWARAGVRLLAIASNDDESAGLLRDAVDQRGIPFPVLLDSDCAVADLYGAITTPHIFLVDPAGWLAYQGAIDDRSFRKRQADVNYLERAVDALLAGRRPDPAKTEPYGCTIVRPLVEEGVAS